LIDCRHCETPATTCGFNADAGELHAEAAHRFGRSYFFGAPAGAGSKTSAANSSAADATAAAKNSQA
jgi:hypothetical protein